MNGKYVVVALGMLMGCAPGSDSDAGSEVGSEPDQTVFDAATGTTYQLNPNRKVIAGEGAVAADTALPEGLGEAKSALGIVGTPADRAVQVQVVQCAASASSGSISVACDLVGSDYLLIGGGAEDVWTGNGAMLWESRPNDADDTGTGTRWMASSKDHQKLAAHTLNVWAIGLKLQRTDGTWMSRAELKQYVKYRLNTTPSSSHPIGTCDVPSGYLVVGGGARANWTGAGQLLTESYPASATSWSASSKDHNVASPATLSVHCIGIASSIPGFGNPGVRRLSTQGAPSAGPITVSASAPSGVPAWMPACYGGQAQYTNRGRMLYRMSPATNADLGTYAASSKDHLTADSGSTTAWFTQIQRQPVQVVNVDLNPATCAQYVTINSAVSQSFEVQAAAVLERIDLNIFPSNSYITQYSLDLYDGEGTTGTRLGTSATVSLASGAPAGWRSFSLAALGIPLAPNHRYTFKLAAVPVATAGILRSQGGACGDVYPYGMEYPHLSSPDIPDVDKDLAFRVFVL